MKIEIFGTGCAKCDDLARTARLAAESLGGDHEIVKVTDLAEFAKRGVMITPALAVDGKVVLSGRLPGQKELAAIFEKERAHT